MHDLVLAAGLNHAGRGWFRIFLEAHHHLDFGAERLLVELECLLAPAVEEQVRCYRHGLSSSNLLRCHICHLLRSGSCIPLLCIGHRRPYAGLVPASWWQQDCAAPVSYSSLRLTKSKISFSFRPFSVMSR